MVSLWVPRFGSVFIDDVFFVWNFGEDSLTSFVASVNTLLPSIQVTLSHNAKNIRFLDLTIYREHNRLLYKIGFKPTDTHAILPPSSCHPPHIFRAILFGQIYRWATHSSTYQDFMDTKRIVQPVWQKQGYTHSAIRSAVRRVLALTMQTPLDWRVGFFPCTVYCFVCSFSFYTLTVFNSFNNESFTILHKLYWKSSNVVYLLVCKRCGISYVGQTSRPLHLRISQHLSDISSGSNTSVAAHFRTACAYRDFSFTALEHCPNLERRLQKENSWIKRLQTLAPCGLNQEINRPNTLRLVVPYSSCSQQVTRLCQRALGDVRVGVSYTKHKNLRTIFRATNQSERWTSFQGFTLV